MQSPIQPHHHLRTAILFHDRLVSDRTFETATTVTVGSGDENLVNMEVAGLREGFELIVAVPEKGYVLRLDPSLRAGRIRLQGERYGLRTLRTRPEWAESGVPIAPGDWGLIKLGDRVWFFFQFVLASRTLRQAIPFSSYRGALSRFVPGALSVFGVGLVLSVLIQGALLFAVHWNDGRPAPDGAAGASVVVTVHAPRALEIIPTDVVEYEEVDVFLDSIEIEYLPEEAGKTPDSPSHTPFP